MHELVLPPGGDYAYLYTREFSSRQAFFVVMFYLLESVSQITSKVPCFFAFAYEVLPKLLTAISYPPNLFKEIGTSEPARTAYKLHRSDVNYGVQL